MRKQTTDVLCWSPRPWNTYVLADLKNPEALDPRKIRQTAPFGREPLLWNFSYVMAAALAMPHLRQVWLDVNTLRRVVIAQELLMEKLSASTVEHCLMILPPRKFLYLLEDGIPDAAKAMGTTWKKVFSQLAVKTIHLPFEE